MAEPIYLASFSDDEESLQHYRTPGSKNGETKYPGLYQPIGKKAAYPGVMTRQANDNLRAQGLTTQGEREAAYQRAREQVAQATAKPSKPQAYTGPNPRNTAELMEYQRRQAEIQQRQQRRQQTNQAIGNAIARGATAAGNAIARAGSGIHEYAVNQRDKRQAEANAKKNEARLQQIQYNKMRDEGRKLTRDLDVARKNEARLQQVQYNKMRDEGRKATRDAQSAYSKAKGAAHYKLEEGKRAMRKVGKSLGETSAKARQKGREVLGKLGIGNYARDVDRIASNAKASAKNAWEKGTERAQDILSKRKRNAAGNIVWEKGTERAQDILSKRKRR